MTPKQLHLLKQYMQALIEEERAKDSSDGGLAERLKRLEIEDELDTLVDEQYLWKQRRQTP